MSEQKETSFKITDRRKFNPDGSPREMSEQEPVAASAEPHPSSQTARDNVVSFPVDGPKASREDSKDTAASAAPTAAGYEGENVESPYREPGKSGVTDQAFVGLLNMLAIETELALGLIANPGEEAPELNLEAARQLIDTLGMLKDKTRGNLSAQEDNLLDEMLAYLRMQFVQISRGQ